MSRRAFTLVELLVVISIIGLLSTVATVAMTSARQNARNIKRKADLKQISKALDLYYSDNNAYPSTGGAWRGSCSAYGSFPNADPSNYPTSSSWIPGLTNKGYMSVLPSDPRSGKGNPNGMDVYCANNPNNNCYLYISNGVDYVLLAYCTPEGTWGSSDPYYCGINAACSTREWRLANEINTTTNTWY